MRENNTNEIKTKEIIRKIILIFLITILFFGSFYTIGTGYKGVLLTFGKAEDTTINEGLHLKIPIIQKIKKIEVRTQKYETELTAASKDLQDVKTRIAINYHLKESNLPILYREIGLNYADRIIYPYEQETNKAITAKYTAEELVTKRELVREDMLRLLKEKLENRGIVVEEISITNFAFSESFNKAIEEKVTAEQLKLKADRDLERIKVEAEQKIASAKAEAESLKLQKLEITNELIELRKIEMQKEAIQKWDGKMPQVTAGIPFITIQTNKIN